MIRRQGCEKSRSRMTVRHLLTHTAGFTAVWNDDAVARMYEERGVVEHFPNEYEKRSGFPGGLSICV